ncbi:MAG: MFS transporter [Acidobacteria bacterium]|nr:MFS transporter [Acidobacteriota bacterium]
MNLLSTSKGRKALFGALYLSEGAPNGFIWWALPTWLRPKGVPLDVITALTASLTLMWTLKFLWAPLVDVLRVRGPGLRAWILGCQALMGLTLLPLLFMDEGPMRLLFVPLMLLHALAAATQDVAIDALAILRVPEAERGAINGWMQVGMLLGRSLFGGGALLMATRIGEKGVLAALVLVIWASGSLLVLSKESPTPRDRSAWDTGLGSAFLQRLKGVVLRRGSLVGLAFALTSGAAFEGVGAVAGPMLVDMGATKETAGWFFAVPAVGAMLGGALVGGALSDRWGRRRCAGLFLLVIVVQVLGLALLMGSFHPVPLKPLMAMLGGLYAGIGLFTAASYALFMDLTDPALGATQFSLFMGAANGCEAWAGFMAGVLIVGRGYAIAMLILALISFLALPLLMFLPSRQSAWQREGPGI